MGWLFESFDEQLARLKRENEAFFARRQMERDQQTVWRALAKEVHDSGKLSDASRIKAEIAALQARLNEMENK